jgi:hypothetical protein
LKTPFIWSGIYLQWGTGREYLQFLKLVIQRSKSHPLDIKVDMMDAPDVLKVDSPIRAQINDLVLEIPRWRSFVCHSGYPTDALMIVHPISNLYAPILESFELLSLSGTPMSPMIMNSFQGGAPLLSRISFRRVNIASCFPPLSSVTCLHLTAARDWMDGEDFLHLLRSSPVLESLHLEGYIVAHQDLYSLALRGENAELASLRCFSFNADATPKCFLESLLNILRCPKLEMMTIHSWDGTIIDSDDLVANVTTLALTIPAYLELRFMELYGIECAQFVANFDFTLLPKLETISLMRCTSPIPFLRLLLPSQEGVNDKGCIWPSLRHIQLSHLQPVDFDYLCKVISYRQTTGGPIESVTIDPGSLDRFPEKVSWMEQHVQVQEGRGVLSSFSFF